MYLYGILAAKPLAAYQGIPDLAIPIWMNDA
jgi:hypothetical protein